ncbi:Acyl-coenzyme A:6-aminopenicillanic-acid-acyltransferase form [Grifola frondosa]|uniref:Acyl-coenzyme A:6-aminopenicillanic-acid-acyltransferase form n=1 Tax=Grifola frondosa TaxID=5627 RepID=A0A1C7LYJ2_GRIFR|nr:Acyl-coenzyme A:6-aminopenicillanic-acid-acyltransferase form [Grifola frondosa]
MLVTTVSTSFVVQLALIYVPFLQNIFQTEALNWADLSTLLMLAAVSLGLHEGRRRYERSLNASITFAIATSARYGDSSDFSVLPMALFNVPRIQLGGSSYEIGLKHGQLLAPQIRDQLEIYRALFREICKFEWPQVLEVAAQFRVAIRNLAPDLLDEMQGIADGVGDIDLLDIVALNSRSEIALDLGTELGLENIDGEKPRDGIDHKDRKAHYMDGHRPGIVGKIGFNSASVGVCLNAIRARPMLPSLLPIHLLLRLALECTSIDTAISTIERLGGTASSQHILIADANGSRGLELSPRGGIYLTEDADGIVVHTNHFLQNKLVDEPPWLTGSPIRLERAHQLCAEIIKDVGRDSLGEVVDAGLLRSRLFCDTVNSPQAICCTPDPMRQASIGHYSILS